MLKYKLEFIIHGTPQTQNEIYSKSWRNRSNNSKKWKKAVFEIVKDALPPQPLKKVKLSLTRYNYRTLDYDGLVASFKPVIDGLCQIKLKKQVLWPGVMIHDGWSVTGPWTVDQAPAPKGQSWIKVVVEEV